MTGPKTRPYSLGDNVAGETAAQVANYILADLRVKLDGSPGAAELCDAMDREIVAAMRDAALAARSGLLETCHTAIAMLQGWPGEPMESIKQVISAGIDRGMGNEPKPAPYCHPVGVPASAFIGNEYQNRPMTESELGRHIDVTANGGAP